MKWSAWPPCRSELPAESIESAYCTVVVADLFRNRAGGWTLGTSILKSMYTVFDFATPAIGFAQLADDAQPDVKPDPYPSPSTSGAWRVHISVVLVAAAVAAVNLL